MVHKTMFNVDLHFSIYKKAKGIQVSLNKAETLLLNYKDYGRVVKAVFETEDKSQDINLLSPPNREDQVGRGSLVIDNYYVSINYKKYTHKHHGQRPHGKEKKPSVPPQHRKDHVMLKVTIVIRPKFEPKEIELLEFIKKKQTIPTSSLTYLVESHLDDVCHDFFFNVCCTAAVKHMNTSALDQLSQVVVKSSQREGLSPNQLKCHVNFLRKLRKNLDDQLDSPKNLRTNNADDDKTLTLSLKLLKHMKQIDTYLPTKTSTMPKATSDAHDETVAPAAARLRALMHYNANRSDSDDDDSDDEN